VKLHSDLPPWPVRRTFRHHARSSPTGNLPQGSPANSPGAATAADPAPSVFDAVRRYGLRLEARKASIEILVVTHAEKTTVEN
jgi:uncharacterized protein (TIGR03435 family)